MAEKQGFPFIAEYLNWPNLIWPNCNWPNLNRPNGPEGSSGPLLGRALSGPLGPPPLRSPAPITRSTLFEFGLLYLYLFNHFMYFSAKFDHLRNSAIHSATSVIRPIGVQPIGIRPLPLLPTASYGMFLDFIAFFLIF